MIDLQESPDRPNVVFTAEPFRPYKKFLYSSIMSRRPRAGRRERSVSSVPAQSPYSTAINADDSQIDSLLADHSDFIRTNSSRLPEFGSALAARTELEKLDSTIQDLKSRPRSDFSTRLSAISHQRDSMFSDDEGIERLRSMNKEATQREDREFSQMQADIADLQANLASVLKQNAARKHAADAARAMRDLAQSDCANRSSHFQQLTRDFQRLRELEKQSKEELRSVKVEIQRAETEEAAVNELESDIKIQEGNLRNFRAEIAKRKKILTDKKSAIQKLLRRAEDFEDQIDLACEGKPINFDEYDDQGSDDLTEPTIQVLSGRSGEMSFGSDDDIIETEAAKVLRMPLPDYGRLKGRVENATRNVRSPRSKPNSSG
jgi:hypothetical protein